MGQTGSQTASSRHPRRILAASAALVAFSAVAGSLGLATGFLEMGDRVNERLPLQSPVVGGLALLLVVAGPFAVLAVAAGRGHVLTNLMALVTGLTLVAWIAVEVLFIREFSPLQPTLAIVGIGFALVGYFGVRRERTTTGRSAPISMRE